MSDTAPATGETTDATETTETGTVEEVDWKAEADKWKAQARKHEERAKTNASAVKDLEQFRQASMTEQEKAVEQAKADARAAAFAEVGAKVAKAEVRAAAAGRLADEQVDTLLDGLNLAAFLDADGEVDRDRITAFIDGIVPKQTDTFPDLAQGARSEAVALNGDPLLRDLKSKLNIR